MPLAFVWTREPNFQSKAILLYLSSLRFCARVSQINTSIFFWTFATTKRWLFIIINIIENCFHDRLMWLTCETEKCFFMRSKFTKRIFRWSNVAKNNRLFYLHNINFFLILLIISWYYKSHYALQHSFVLFFDASFYILDKKEFNDLFKY